MRILSNDVEVWWDRHGGTVIAGRVGYRWPPTESPARSIRRRVELARRASDHAKRTGTLGKDLGAAITAWGFNGATAVIDRIRAADFETTMREALALADGSRLAESAGVLTRLPRIGISTASKSS